MTTPLPPLATDHDSFEARWSQWQANGARQDRAGHIRAVIAAVLVGCGVSAWLALAIFG